MRVVDASRFCKPQVASTLADRIKGWGKDVAKRLLETAGLYRRGQFWGWHTIGIPGSAGYLGVTDGFIQTPNERTYFIEGRVATA